MAQQDVPAGEEQQFECQVQVENAGSWKKKISVTIPRSEIEKEQNHQLGEFRWTADVPGFRKGRAPRRLIEKRYGEELETQTKLRLLARAFDKIESEHEFEVLTEPDLDPEMLELPADGDFQFSYEIEIKPEFELGKIEGMKIEKPPFEVTQERVNEAVDQLRRRLGRIEDTNEPAKEDDMVLANVTAKVEDAEPETHEGITLRVGQTAVLGVLVEDMDKHLAGAKPGETRTLKVKAPETHEKENWRNKEIEFSIEMKSVRQLIPAELNEELFKRFGVSDEAELRERVSDDLEAQADREVRNQMAQQVYRKLDEQVQFDLPVDLAARHADRMLQRRFYELLQQGVPQEQIQEVLDQLRASSGEEARRQLKMSFVMDKVAEELDVEVSEMEVNGVIAQIAMRYGRRPERVREELVAQGRLEQIEHQIRDEKAVDRILEMAEVTDAPAPDAGEGKKKK